MKNYKWLAPLVLVLVFFASIYFLYSDREGKIQEYNKALATARDYRAQEIQKDAELYYMEALGIRDSAELYLEIGQFYWESGLARAAEDWGEQFVEEYPTEPMAYEFMLSVYYGNEDYNACFDVLDTLEKRELSSDYADGIFQKIQYSYTFNSSYTELEEVGVYSGGLCPVKIKGKWGYANEKGRVAIAAKYTNVGAFVGGIAPVADESGKAYYIDNEGNKKRVILGVDNVVQLGLMYGEYFSLYNGESWGFYNANNDFLFGGYEEATSIGNGIAGVRIGDDWTLVDCNGHALTADTYTAVARDGKDVIYRNDRLFAAKNGVYCMLDGSGNIVGDEVFEDAQVFNDTTFAAVKQNGKWGFINNKGEFVIEPSYTDARSFSNGFAAVKVNDKWGFIDMENNMIIEPQFQDVRDFSGSGSAFVLMDGDWECLLLYQYNH